MAKKVSRYKSDSGYAQVAKMCSYRTSYLLTLCRALVRERLPADYAKLQAAAYKKYPVPRIRRSFEKFHGALKEILNGDANDK